LQFVTGTSGVPSRGFSVLQGIDGNIKKFTIHGVDSRVYVLPRAHTCFNRIDLPDYATRKELYQHLKTAITMSRVALVLNKNKQKKATSKQKKTNEK
jgi:HECT-domain (ubiquitin-transferase)